MLKLLARLASSVLLVSPLAGHAGEVTRDAPPSAASRTRGSDTAPVAAASAGRAVASAAADEQEFLEYLGSWDGSDEDWVVAATGARTRDAKASADEARTGQEQAK